MRAGLPKTAAIAFTVFGRPRPQGSKRHVGHGIMIESSKALKPWRQEVSATALSLGAPMFAPHVPVEVTLNFYFTRPRSAKKRKGMTVKPDADKLVRAVFDSLKGILLHDDSHVVEIHARKDYGGPERVEIRIQEAV